MPIPQPREDEKEQEFVGRCMADEGMVKEYEEEQRAAICYSTWKAKDKEKLHCGHPEDHQDGDPNKPLLQERMKDHPPHQKVLDQTLSEVKDGLVRIALAYTGNYERNGKSFSITLDDLKSMMKNLQRREIPLDYEHLSANPDAPPGHSRASGWVKAPDRIEDFGPNRKVLYGWAEFTPAALMAIRQREYKYFSPEIHWTDTDEQGKHVGTRLAAGAVTNRPFLKDLPPIEIGAGEFPALLEAVALSEHKRLINVGDVHVPADMNRSKRKEEGMAKFKLKKITSGDDKGKHGIFDGDQMVGVADAGTLEDYANELHADELDELRKLKASKKMKADDHDDDSCPNSDELKKLRLRVGDGPIQKLEASAAELTTLKAKYAEDMAELDELRKLKAKAKAGDLYIKHQDDDDSKADMKKMTEKLGITLTEVDRELTPVRKLEVACLKEFAETDSGEKSMQLAESLLDKGRLTTGGYLKAQKIDRLLDQAIRQAKILPKQRKAMYLLAIQDFDQVSALLADSKPVLDLSIRGIEGSGNETMKASEELETMVVQYMKEKSVDRATALRDVTRKNPELWRRHTQQTATLMEG